MKKKVLLISESMGGGLRKHVVQLIENLNENNFEIYFIHGTKNLDEAFLASYDNLSKQCKMIPCEALEREIILRKDYEAFRFILKIVNEIKPDIVHCHSSKAGVLGRIVAKNRGIKKIFYTPHAYSFLAPEFNNKRKRFFILIERILSKIATTKTFNVSIDEKNQAIARNIDKSEKFEVIYNGLPEENFLSKSYYKKMLGYKVSDIIIGNNARMSDQKNPMLFMKIAKKVIEKNKKVFFVWAGKGEIFPEIEDYIKNQGLSDNVRLLGDRKDSEFIVKAFDIFLITSRYEGLPYSLIESLRAGVPIVSTNFDGINEIIVDDIVGKVGNSPEEMVNIILKMLESDATRENAKIVKVFKDKFSIQEMINKIEKNYMTD